MVALTDKILPEFNIGDEGMCEHDRKTATYGESYLSVTSLKSDEGDHFNSFITI